MTNYNGYLSLVGVSLTRRISVFIFLGILFLNPLKSRAQCFEDVVCDNPGVNWDHSLWDQEIRSAVRILIDTVNLETSCTGVLLNNTSNNNELYVLTAFHCLDLSPRDGILSPQEIDAVKSFKYYFHYYNEICDDDGSTRIPIQLNKNYDAELVAAWDSTDFALIRLHETFDYCSPDMENHLFWAGWTRSATPYSSGTDQVVGLNHPTESQGGLPLKVCVFKDDPVILGANTFMWEVPRLWDLGDITDGSSGSPLFNNEHLVTGQQVSSSTYLPCDLGSSLLDYTTYGRFDLSWLGGGTPETQLRAWLCPDCDGVTPDPVSLGGIEYIGGSAVGGIGFSCSDISFTVKTKSLPACCWEIEVDITGNACINGVKVSLNGFREQIITEHELVDGKLVYRYCISGSSSGVNDELRVTVLGTNNAPLCPEEVFPLVQEGLLCDACDCSTNSFDISFEPAGNSTNPGEEGWCCYIPTLEKTDDYGCDIYGADIDGIEYTGLYSINPLLVNVGDKVQLPEICAPLTFIENLPIGLQLFDARESQEDGDQPICEVSGDMEACCSCELNYNLEILTTNSTPDECCFRVNAYWVGSDDSCKPKSVLLYDDQGVYTGNSSSVVAGINFVSFHNICIDRNDFPKTYELRFFKEFIVNTSDLPEAMCSLYPEFTPCDFDCCSLYDLQTAEYYTFDPVTQTSQKCVDLVVNQSHSVPGCDLDSIEIIDENGVSTFHQWTGGNINLCCEDYPSQVPGFGRTWQFVLYGMNGPLVDPLTGEPCRESLFFSCGDVFGAKRDLKESTDVPAVNNILYSQVYPNPAGSYAVVEFALPQEEKVNVKVVDGKGAFVQEIKAIPARGGLNQVRLETSHWRDGLYRVVLDVKDTQKSLPLSIHH
ncbi:MAG: trypsin-like peptidase domain-containing protein [Owenweeksia sp.]